MATARFDDHPGLERLAALDLKLELAKSPNGSTHRRTRPQDRKLRPSGAQDFTAAVAGVDIESFEQWMKLADHGVDPYCQLRERLMIAAGEARRDRDRITPQESVVVAREGGPVCGRSRDL